MTMMIDRELDQALQRYGDDLYRLAVLLSLDMSAASNALLRAMRRVAAADAAFDQRLLLEALVAALPPERPAPRRSPAWIRSAVRPEEERLLAALIGLPWRQRLALGLSVLRSFEQLADPPLAQRSDGDGAGESLTAPTVAADRRAGLLALAPAAFPHEPLPAMTGDGVLDGCRLARGALLSGDTALLDEPAVRGHLALCSECRAAAAVWRSLNTRVEELLRAVLRDVRLPPGLDSQLHAAASGDVSERMRLLRSPWIRRALVPLVALAAIVAVVLPRPGAISPEIAAVTTAAPAELVRQASERLYMPPAGEGIWQGRYAVRWIFADASYAMLDGSLWLDTEQRRHRLQLIHAEGGGPFELQVGDGEQRLWYSVDPRYAASIYPQIVDRWSNRVQIELSADEQDAMFDARIASGAWELPAAYLRQAVQADELRSWGRSTAEDGTDLAVLSFRGTSPLGLPDGAARAAGDVTVLLSLSVADGTLYEIRELIGSEQAEQSGRSVWRYLGGEWLAQSPAAEAVFDMRLAQPRASGFEILPTGSAAPELPTVPSEALQSLAQAVIPGPLQLLVPAEAPAGTERAALIGFERQPDVVIVYFGAGKTLTIRTRTRLDSSVASFPRTAETERIKIGQATALLRPGPSQRYEAVLGSAGDARGRESVARISAQGFSRSELIGVLESLAPLSIEAVRRQSPLFIGPRGEDPSALDALLGALAEAPPPHEGFRHTIAQVYSRQFAGADALADPYHLPPYGGRPDTVLVETWSRAAQAAGEGTEGQLLVERTTVMRGPDGVVFDRSYSGPRGSWTYDAARSEAFEFSDAADYPSVDDVRYVLMRVLACGSGQVEGSGGQRAVVVTEPNWRRTSCVLPHYGQVHELQSRAVVRNGDAFTSVSTTRDWEGLDRTPFLADVSGNILTTVVSLTEEGQLARFDVYVGGSQSPRETRVEGWELVSDEVLPAERMPAGLFVPQPPPAFVKLRFGATDAAPVELVGLTLAQARGMLGGAVYSLSDTLEDEVAAEDGSAASFQTELSEISASQFDPDVAYGSYLAYPDPFEGALYHSVALRFAFTIGDDAGGVVRVVIYQGRAERFGAFLRARVRWMASEPARLALDGELVPGWLVTTLDGRRWAIAEREGTLLVVAADSPEQLSLLERLRRV